MPAELGTGVSHERDRVGRRPLLGAPNEPGDGGTRLGPGRKALGEAGMDEHPRQGARLHS